MAKFKVGDRVRAIKNDNGRQFFKGEKGTIVSQALTNIGWHVQWDKGNQFPAWNREIELIKGGKKMAKKKYPAKIYVQFNCPDNEDDRSWEADNIPDVLDIDRSMMVYVPQKLIMVERKFVEKEVKE
jgi:hypothetical protein